MSSLERSELVDPMMKLDDGGDRAEEAVIIHPL